MPPPLLLQPLLQGGVEVRVGDCVELEAAPGEDDTRLGEVLALWAEKLPADGQLRLCKLRRYYRPQVGM